MRNKNYKQLFELYEKDDLHGHQKKVVDVFYSRMQHNGMKPEEVDTELEKKMYAGIMKRVKTPVQRNWVKYTGVAAIALLFISIVSYAVFGGLFGKKTTYITVTAKADESVRVTLPDGSVAELSAGSTLVYPESFDGEERKVELKGQSSFVVERDEKHPFYVVSGSLVTRVLGTQFIVSDTENGIPEVSVISGKVRVEEPVSKKYVILTKNEKVSWDKLSGVLTKSVINSLEPDQSKEIRFDNATMKTVIAELNKQFKISLLLKTPEYDCEGISGDFKGASVESVLKGIQFINEMDFKTMENGTIEIYLKPCAKE